MRKLVSFFVLLLLIVHFSGCLVYKKVSYEINLNAKNSGEAVITLYDIKSDAVGNKEFEEDKSALFNHMLKSEQFLEDMKYEGKDITSRRLFLEKKSLNGEVKFKFTDISRIEGILHQDGFYFLTVDLKDSILSTNGEIIVSPEHKRILWKDTEEILKFEMMTDAVPSKLRDLSQFLDK